LILTANLELFQSIIVGVSEDLMLVMIGYTWRDIYLVGKNGRYVRYPLSLAHARE